MQVGQFTDSVKQEIEHDLGTAPYGGSVVKAPKVLADIVEAIAAAVYVDCKFDLEKLWQVSIHLSCNYMLISLRSPTNLTVKFHCNIVDNIHVISLMYFYGNLVILPLPTDRTL